ncbi:MAG: hypothetical protein ACFCVK_10210 [Acidimicrobiales bacterium]
MTMVPDHVNSGSTVRSRMKPRAATPRPTPVAETLEESLDGVTIEIIGCVA